MGTVSGDTVNAIISNESQTTTMTAWVSDNIVITSMNNQNNESDEENNDFGYVEVELKKMFSIVSNAYLFPAGVLLKLL